MRTATTIRSILPMVASSALFAAPARAAYINFDTFPDSSLVPSGTIITTQYASVGAIFSSPAPGGGPTAGFLVGEASSLPNFLYGSQNSAGLHDIFIDFTSAMATVSMNLISVGCGTVTVTAYASDLSTVIDSVSVTHGPSGGVGFGNVDAVALSGAGIWSVSVTIAQTGPVTDGFGLDDLSFDSHVVPLPLAAPTAALGLALIGLRRRR